MEGEMKTMKGEVRLNIPAAKAWRMYRDNQIMSKINPSMLVRASYIQGDGDPGSLRLLQLGPVSRYVKESIQKIEKVEEGGRSSTYQVVGGQIADMYRPYRVTTSFTPVTVGGREDCVCVAHWKAEFKPLTPAVPPPAKARDVALDFLACFDK